MKPEELTIEQVSKAIDWHPDGWEGNCYAVACQILKAGLVKGRAVYGAWYGGINKSGYWAHRAGTPFVRHGWIELPDGRILDPTRWSFEAVEPYIWIGPGDSREYDEGNNTLAERMLPRNPWPEPDGSKTYRFELLAEIVRDVEHYGAELTDEEIDGLDYRHIDCDLTGPQVLWLANFPLTLYGNRDHAREVYTQIAEHGFQAYVPMDNWKAVMGE